MMENLDLAYSMFNQYLFQDAKNNIEHLEYYFSTNPNTMSNPLIGEFIYAVKNYTLDSIDLPLFQSIITKTGKSQGEASKIINEITKWKMFTREQMVPAKKFLNDICAGSVIRRANSLYKDSPADFLKYIKNANFKSESTDYLKSVDFAEVDINSIVADGTVDGIASHYEWINSTFEPDYMIEKGQLISVCMSPGCFTGDTKVMLASGTYKTMEELYNEAATEIPVISWTPTFGYQVAHAKSCVLTKHVSELIELSISDGGIIRCTKDHLLMLDHKDGRYMEAQYIRRGDILKANKEGIVQEVIGVELIRLERSEPVYDLYEVSGTSNFIIITSLNGISGVVVHNCGKSLFAMSEALSMASRGHRVHYLALGDLNQKDFIVRMGAMYSGMTFGDTKRNLTAVYKGMAELIGDRLGITTAPAGQVDVDEYIEFIKDQPYDVLIVDYDSNFKLSEGDNMYSEYGEIYAKLTALSGMGKIVYILAQPKVSAWKNEIIDISDVGESSRKQHTVDMIITRGRVEGSPNNLGCFKMAKNRRGEVGAIDYTIRLNNGRFKSIPREVYERLKAEKEKMNYTEADIDRLIGISQSNKDKIERQLSGVPIGDPGFAPPQSSIDNGMAGFKGGPNPFS